MFFYFLLFGCIYEQKLFLWEIVRRNIYIYIWIYFVYNYIYLWKIFYREFIVYIFEFIILAAQIYTRRLSKKSKHSKSHYKYIPLFLTSYLLVLLFFYSYIFNWIRAIYWLKFILFYILKILYLKHFHIIILNTKLFSECIAAIKDLWFDILLL